MQMLIDPVCLMTCCPQLLHSFIYKVPTWDSKLLTTPTGFMDLLRFIFSRDLMVAEVGLSLLHAVLPILSSKGSARLHCLLVYLGVSTAAFSCAHTNAACLFNHLFIARMSSPSIRYVKPQKALCDLGPVLSVS